ncbi:MAG: DNA-binding protein [Terriglobales bacterium]
MAELQATEKEAGEMTMPLTRDFKETIKARVERDPEFRKELLIEGIESLLSGDVDTGKAILRDYINATVGFKELSEIVHRSPKSLMRMLGPSGNPHAQNLFDIIAYLQQEEGVRLKIRSARPGQAGHRSLRRRA